MGCCRESFTLCLTVFQVRAGFMVNLIGVLVISLAINTWGTIMFDLNTIPAWANSTANP